MHKLSGTIADPTISPAWLRCFTCPMLRVTPDHTIAITAMSHGAGSSWPNNGRVTPPRPERALGAGCGGDRNAAGNGRRHQQPDEQQLSALAAWCFRP